MRHHPPKITDLHIKNLQPKGKRYLKLYADGFGVRVSTSGEKTFIYWYSRQGRMRQLTLGRYPYMSLKEAMAAHHTARGKALKGEDPAAEKQDAIAASDRAPNVQKLVDEFARHVLAAQPSGPNTLRQIKLDIVPRLGPRTPLDSLRRRDAVVIVDAVRERGPRIGNSAAGILARLGNFAVERGLLEANPFAKLKKLRIDPKTRVLTDEELARFVAQVSQVDLHPLTPLALLAILITGQRPGEVAGMRKDEISADGVWTIPAARYKTGVAQAVPLSPLALDLVRGAAVFNEQSPFVFPSPQSLDRPIDRHSLSRAVKRKLAALGVAPFTPHDLRRTCRTGMAALRVPDPVAEKVIGHKLEGMLAVYNVHPYMDEKRDALNRWAAHLQSITRSE